jgi:choline dehydrogenase-like flavoprotein
MFGGPQQPAFIETIKNTHNVSFCPDLNGGNPTCASFIPLTLNPHRNDSRSSSAEAYLTPVETKRNGWTVLVQQEATKILFKNGTSPALATGVEFGRSDGSRYIAYAKKEVILAAGAFVVSPEKQFLSAETKQ